MSASTAFLQTMTPEQIEAAAKQVREEIEREDQRQLELEIKRARPSYWDIRLEGDEPPSRLKPFQRRAYFNRHERIHKLEIELGIIDRRGIPGRSGPG